MGPMRVLFIATTFLTISLLFTWSTIRTPSAHGNAFSADAEAESSWLSRLSLNSPSTIFSSSAIISLTDDSSTFFVARSAAYGPELPEDGLSGQIWLGSDFTEDLLGGGHFAESNSGVLGCDDAEEGDPEEASTWGLGQDGQTLHNEADSGSRSRVINHRRLPDTRSIHGFKEFKNEGSPSSPKAHKQRKVPSTGDHRPSFSQSQQGNIKSLQESAEIAGKIVLLKRGGCGFLDKTRWVQNRGGKALIVGDNVPRGSLITMWAKGDLSNITIPSVFTSHTTAHLLASLIADHSGILNHTSANLAAIPAAYKSVKDLRKLTDDEASEADPSEDRFEIGVEDWRDPEMMDPDHSSASPSKKSPRQPNPSNGTEPHEGLWVTLTPTSVAISPFFDTLLVLVVSPLITLTIVYLILVIRNKLRRRRWRAPTAVVERLPVRTFTLQSVASSHSGSAVDLPSTDARARSSSSERRRRTATERDPLLTDIDSPAGDLLSEVPAATPISAEEKARAAAGRSVRPRRFRGRQMECVICLEEYVDGLSRVMRLPCGHEFHEACIAPWLTNRRRTCPICKGDVVRSLEHEDRRRRGSEDGESSGDEEVRVEGESEDVEGEEGPSWVGRRVADIRRWLWTWLGLWERATPRMD